MVLFGHLSQKLASFVGKFHNVVNTRHPIQYVAVSSSSSASPTIFPQNGLAHRFAVFAASRNRSHPAKSNPSVS